MAENGQDHLLQKLAERGEEVLHALNKLAESPPGSATLRGMRDRMDDLQKKVRGVDALEKKVAALEKRVKALEGKGTTTAKPRTAARKTTASKPKTAAPKRSTATKPPAPPAA
jgi:hypothetical protein